MVRERSQRMARRRKLPSQVMVRSTVQRRRYRRSLRPPCVAGLDSSCTDRSTRCPDAANGTAMDRCRKPCRRSPAPASAADGPGDAAVLRGSSRAWSPRAGLPPGMQSEGGLPEEDPGRQPPPSTSCLSPGGFCPLRRIHKMLSSTLRSGARGRPPRRCRGGLGSRGRIFSHCASVSNGPDRAIGPPPGAAAPCYASSEKTQPPSFQSLAWGCATASYTIRRIQALLPCVRGLL